MPEDISVPPEAYSRYDMPPFSVVFAQVVRCLRAPIQTPTVSGEASYRKRARASAAPALVEGRSGEKRRSQVGLGQGLDQLGFHGLFRLSARHGDLIDQELPGTIQHLFLAEGKGLGLVEDD